jgi:hypothetical protein
MVGAMPNRDHHLGELEKLVEDNRIAFERAKHLLAAMREQSHREAEYPTDSRQTDSLNTDLPPPDWPAPIQRDSGLQFAAAWLDLESLGRVEVTSEALPGWPISSALSLNSRTGWRSKEPGGQTIRLVFATPLSIQRIQLVFVEEAHDRTQEFVLRWLAHGARVYQEIVRQQYVFSPRGSTREIEDYRVNLRDLAAIELCIKPDLNARDALASLAKWSLA